MEFIKSTTNLKIKAVCALKDSKGRKSAGLFIAEGVRIVKDATFTPESIFVSEEHIDFAKNYESVCPTFVVSREVFEKMSDTKSPQGVLGVYKIPDSSIKAPEGDYIMVLDGVKDPGNIGTIIRTAPACGFRDIYLTDSADAYSPKVVRSSMGGVFRSNIYIGQRDEIISTLKKSGANICALDMGGESVFDASVNLPIALVVGSEAQGVSKEFREIADKVLCLPMKDDTESLNAGVSAGVLMYLVGFKK